MNLHNHPRRPEFDTIADGWGADSVADLAARCQLLAEWWGQHFPLTLAELKVARAMSQRLRNLGGFPPAELPN